MRPVPPLLRAPLSTVTAPHHPPKAEEVVGAISRIGMADDIAGVWNELRHQLARFGFDRLNYGHSPALHDPENMSRSMRFALSSHPDTRVRDIYVGPRLDRSPMRIWAARNVGALSWSEQPRLLREYGMEDIAGELKALLERLGIFAGYTIAFPLTAQNGRGSLGLTARAGLTQADVDRIWTRHGDAIMALSTAAHGRLAHMPFPLKDYTVTDRQREVLGWIADGKTVQDVAIVTGLSVSAVEKHLARARAGLEAETTVQAIARLALLNQLHMPSAE